MYFLCEYSTPPWIFGLSPKMCQPSANTENSRSTLEKPLVPRVTVRFLGNRSKSTFRRDLNFKEITYLSSLFMAFSSCVLVFPCRRFNLSSWWFLNERKIKKNNNNDGIEYLLVYILLRIHLKVYMLRLTSTVVTSVV